MASIHQTPSKHGSVEKFWRWFESVAQGLAEDFEDSEVLEALDEKVSEFGEIVWELGPGEAKKNMLVLSPDGDPDLLPETRDIVDQAPDVPGWEFHAARPARPFPLKFSLGSTSHPGREVDASGWSCVLLKFKDGSTEVIVAQPECGSWSEEDRFTAAIVALDGLLGEERRMAGITRCQMSTRPKASR